jgi:hypothetical protein
MYTGQSDNRFSSSYTSDAMSEEEAKKYAIKMGITDSLRGIQQMYGNITGNDDLLEKLKKKDEKLKKIFENPNYGDDVFKYYLGAAVVGDPVGYIPVAGWLKKSKTLSQSMGYGAGMGFLYGGAAYVGEGESRVFNALSGATVGGVIGLGGAGITRGIQKAMGKNPTFAKTLKQRQQENIETGATKTSLGENISEADYEELTNQAVKNIQKEKPGAGLEGNLEKFYNNIGGEKIWNVAVQNWGTGLSAVAGGLGGYNAFDDEESTQAQKITAALLMSLAGGAGAKVLGKITYKDKTLSEMIQSGIVDNYGLPKGYVQLVKSTFGEVNELRQQFLKSAQEIATLEPDERKNVYLLMTGQINEMDNLGNFSLEARKVITKTGQEMVDSGLLDPDIFQRNIDTYLHRSYTKHANKTGNTSDYKAAKRLKLIGDELKRRGKKLDKVISKKAYEASFKPTNKTFGRYDDYTTVLDVETVVSKNRYNKLTERLDRKKVIRDKDYQLNKTVDDIRQWEVIADEGDQLLLRHKNKVELRRDYTAKERADLGEIEDAAFAVAETGRLMTNDLAVYKLYNNIAKEKKFSLDIEEFNNAIDNKLINPEDWTEVPTDKLSGVPVAKFGTLAGKYVPTEIYDDLTKIQMSKEAGGAVLNNYLAINRVWKKSKTAWNPVVHVNNTVSNMILYDLAGAKYRFMHRGFKELAKGIEGDESARLYKLAKANGVFDSDLLSRELTDQTKDVMDSALKNLSDELNPEIIGAQKYSLETFNKLSAKGYDMTLGKLDNFYQLEDQAFRMGLFMDRLAKGMKVQEAAADAKKWFIDYDINAPFINFMRRFPTPFISYTYRALPLLAEAAVKRPWKYAKWAGLAYGLNEVGKGKVPFAEYFSDDPDFGRFQEEIGNEEAERLLMRENLRNKLFGIPFMPDTLIKTPFASGRDKETPLYLDVRRFIPGGDVFAVGDKGIGIPIGFGKSLKLPEVITPNFGAPGEVFFPLLTGVDPFTLQKIKGLGLGNDDKVKMQHILSRLIPNIPTTAFTAPLFGEDSKVVKYDPFSQSFGSQKILKAMRQIQDPENIATAKFGADFTPFEAILSTFGFKLQPQQFTKLVGIRQQEFKSLYSNARQSFYKISKDYAERKISKEEAEERVNEIYKILERAKIKSEALSSQLKEAREKKYEGGEIEDVAQVKEEPEDRINPLTNEPYSVTSGVKKPEEIEIESEKRQEFKFGKLVKGAIKAFHGSPHDFKKFDIEKMGTGEGFQVFGKGLYFTDTEKVAQTYKKNKNGKIYKVKLNVSEDDLIDYDKSIGSQSKNHQNSLSKIIDDLEVEDLIYFRNSSSIDTDDWIDISRYYDKDNDMFREAIKDVILEEGNNVKDFLKIVNEIKGAGKAEEFLKSYNIQGIKYKDGLTRAAKEGTPVSKNYVIFDPRVIEISKKYGVAIPVAGAMLKEYDKGKRQNLKDGGFSNEKEYDKRLEEYQKRANMKLVNKEAQMNMLMGEGYTDPRFIKSTGNALIDKYGMKPFPAEGSGFIPSSKQLGVEGPDIIYNRNTLGYYSPSKDIIAFKDLSTQKEKEGTQKHEFIHRAADKIRYFDNFHKSEYLKKEAPDFAGRRGKQLKPIIEEALAHSYEYDDLKDDKLREDIEFRISQYNLYDDDKKTISYELFKNIGKIKKDFEDYLEKYDKEKTKDWEK